MATQTPTRSYQFAPLPFVPGHRIVNIVYTVPSISRPGEVHTITQDLADGRLRCDCPARKQCWAEKAVIAGLVKPRVRIEPKSAVHTATRTVRTPLPVDDLYGDAAGEGRTAVAQRQAPATAADTGDALDAYDAHMRGRGFSCRECGEWSEIGDARRRLCVVCIEDQPAAFRRTRGGDVLAEGWGRAVAS